MRLRLFSFGGYGLALVVFGAYDGYPDFITLGSSVITALHWVYQL